MGLFYFDNKLQYYENHFQWDQALKYLEELYLAKNDIHVLNSLIGFSWFYLIEGASVSKKYSEDPNITALHVWKKYIDLGSKEANNYSSFNFVAGYTLSLHGFYIDEEYEKKGILFLRKCLNLDDNIMLLQLAENFIENEHSDKYIPLRNGKEICTLIFSEASLTDEYFKEMFDVN